VRQATDIRYLANPVILMACGFGAVLNIALAR
jgi:hypothetical protein